MFVAESVESEQTQAEPVGVENMDVRPRIQLAAMIIDARRMLQLVNAAAPGALHRVAIAAVLEAAAITCLPYTTRGLIDAIASARTMGLAAGPLAWVAAEAILVAARLVATTLL